VGATTAAPSVAAATRDGAVPEAQAAAQSAAHVRAVVRTRAARGAVVARRINKAADRMVARQARALRKLAVGARVRVSRFTEKETRRLWLTAPPGDFNKKRFVRWSRTLYVVGRVHADGTQYKLRGEEAWFMRTDLLAVP
jgi:hypothetical protein